MSVGRQSVEYGTEGTKALVTKIILLTFHLKNVVGWEEKKQFLLQSKLDKFLYISERTFVQWRLL